MLGAGTALASALPAYPGGAAPDTGRGGGSPLGSGLTRAVPPQDESRPRARSPAGPPYGPGLPSPVPAAPPRRRRVSTAIPAATTTAAAAAHGQAPASSEEGARCRESARLLVTVRPEASPAPGFAAGRVTASERRVRPASSSAAVT